MLSEPGTRVVTGGYYARSSSRRSSSDVWTHGCGVSTKPSEARGSACLRGRGVRRLWSAALAVIRRCWVAAAPGLHSARGAGLSRRHPDARLRLGARRLYDLKRSPFRDRRSKRSPPRRRLRPPMSLTAPSATRSPLMRRRRGGNARRLSRSGFLRRQSNVEVTLSSLLARVTSGIRCLASSTLALPGEPRAARDGFGRPLLRTGRSGRVRARLLGIQLLAVDPMGPRGSTLRSGMLPATTSSHIIRVPEPWSIALPCQSISMPAAVQLPRS